MPAEMTGRERVLTVLKHGQPDRVPTFEWVIDASIIQAMAGNVSYEDFVDIFEWDVVVCNPRFNRRPIGHGLYEDEWGVKRRIAGDGFALPVEELAPIKDWRDLEKLHPPDPYEPSRYEHVKAQIKRFKGKKAIGVRVRDVTSHARDLLGYTEMLASCASRPEFVNALVEKTVDHSIAIVRVMADLGAEIVTSGDDIADNKQTLFSPQTYQALFLPHLSRFVQAIHDCGMYHWKHTDGNIWAVMSMFNAAGIDGIDPVDPLGGMDLATMKQRWGDRLAIKGNVDCVNLLTRGSKEQVIETVKGCIRAAAPGGGYVCASSNSIHSDVDPELYRTMLKAIKDFGQYPLDLDLLAPAG